MKKIFNFILVLAILFFTFQIGITLLKKSHNIDYSLKISDKKVLIHEEYYKDKQSDYYYFEVTINKIKFVFDKDNTFNKQKKVIDNIRLYEEEDLTCISPVYIKNNNDPEIICNVGKKQYSYTEVKDKYNLKDFVESIDKFDEDKYNLSEKTITGSRNTIYNDHIYDNENILVYEYSSLIKVTSEDYYKINFADYDIYENELGVLIDKYYVIPKYDKKPEYSRLLIIDIEEETTKELEIEEKLSTNIYINGVVKDKLYIFDKSNLIQYEINPKEVSYKIIGNKNINAQYYDGEWHKRNIYDFSNQTLKFKNNYPIKENYVEAFETDKFYYYYNSNNEFYKVYKKNLNKPIFLFAYNDFKEVVVVNDCIYFIDDDTLYRYDDNGLKKILVNKEFQYNYNNIYSVYFK
ncbi:MAG: hypothetical protein IJO43_01300 [Bacilli bacterium]|nr:hypothetical protein [Bacilli bacterium]